MICSRRFLSFKDAITRNLMRGETTFCNNVKWRIKNKLPEKPNERGPCTDYPDYTFADGRPTPYNVGQRRRIIVQSMIAEKILNTIKLADFIKEEYVKKTAIAKSGVQNRLDSKLKHKGRKRIEKPQEEDPKIQKWKNRHVKTVDKQWY